MGRVLVAFSGGVDSTFLLKTAQDALGHQVLAVTSDSCIHPRAEKKEAAKLANEWNIKLIKIKTGEMENPQFIQNTPKRCYECKKKLFERLKKIAQEENIPFILDGFNADDLEDFRPGAQAGVEYGILSPLKDEGISKLEIRELSRWLGLPTWDKPSMACLATRVPYYQKISRESLKKIEKAEAYLRLLGFTQVRVRHYNETARLEIDPEEFQQIINREKRSKIIQRFKELGYIYISLDLEGYRTGSLNMPHHD